MKIFSKPSFLSLASLCLACSEIPERIHKNGSGAQTLHLSMWVVLWPWPLNTAVSLLLGVITYQETGGKLSRKNRPGFCSRQFGFWQLGWEGQFPLSICFNVKNGRKSVFSILLTLVYALTQMPQILHSWDNTNNKRVLNFNVANIWSNIFFLIASIQNKHCKTSTMCSPASCEVVAREASSPDLYPFVFVICSPVWIWDLLPCLGNIPHVSP